MEESKMKNIIVLKNLPSNLVDEAILVLKKNNIKLPEHIEKKNENIAKGNSRDYILKEAENVVSSYLSDIEKNKKENIIKNTKIEKKYKRLKFVTICVTIAFAIATLI